MIIGVLKEIKDNENRVAITPRGVKYFVGSGHSVLIEKNAGAGSGIKDELYEREGAEIITDKNILSQRSQLILKIKEPLPQEYSLFQPDQMLFTFFHFASNKELTEAMMKAHVTCIAYETVETERGRLPLLSPMSEIAGKMAPIVAAHYLSMPAGGKGILASSVGHSDHARFIILGGGNAGRAAASVALGIGADVTIVERSRKNIERLKKMFRKVSFAIPTQKTIERLVCSADAVIGTVHVPGARAPKIVSREMVRQMEKGSVIVDVAVDQGGCFETTRPTTHSNPVYFEEGILHYCVANMPGAYPRTSTYALTGETLKYALKIAQKGIDACRQNELSKGLNIYKGKVTNRRVAKAHGFPYTDPVKLFV
jgi:alanine dehydrogenase